MRTFIFASLASLLLGGCSNSTTRLDIDVSRDTSGTLSSVAISVFDPFGLIGQTTVSPSPLPGQVVVDGLPDKALALRIAAVGMFQGQQLLGAAHVTVAPHQITMASVVVSASTKDADGDLVPDVIDDCPAAFDPNQIDPTGSPPGNACSGASDGGTHD